MKGGANMLPRIKELKPLSGFRLYVLFDSGERRIYNVKKILKLWMNSMIWKLYRVYLSK